MRRAVHVVTVASLLAVASSRVWSAVDIVVDHNDDGAATAGFRFARVPPPARNDAASGAVFSLVAGRRDVNGGGLDKLHDGSVPREADQPSANFFFAAATDGGRLRIDLGRIVEIARVHSYSWHPAERGPQVYALYGSDGQADGFDLSPQSGKPPQTCGWQLVADVDTRPQRGRMGGQYAVSLAGPAGEALGMYRYLLFDVSRTEKRDAFGNTFFSELDVIERGGAAPQPVDDPGLSALRETVTFDDGRYRVTVDTSETPDLTHWVHRNVIPMVREWYPKLIALLPSDGFEAPSSFTIVFDEDMRGVAATSGVRIRCAGGWMRRNIEGESLGALFHEMVHVVQQYGHAPRKAGASRPPGWLTEGITDYLRFYLFEPETRGAEIGQRAFSRARFDGSYRVTGNFLNWVCTTHGPDFVPKLNAAIREGRYGEEIWMSLSGCTLEELGRAWKADLGKKLEIVPGE